MSENKKTCPVCFTKMKAHKDGLICPECGYKLCDHYYNRQDIFDTNHAHTPEYTTAYPTARTSPNSQPTANSGTRPVTSTGSQPATNSYPRPTANPSPNTTSRPTTRNNAPTHTSADADQIRRKIMKIVRIVVIIYALCLIFSVFGSFITSFLTHVFF